MDQPNDLSSLCVAGIKECPALKEIRRLRDECKRLAELTQVDALTGLYNFQYLISALEREMERTRRTGLPMGLVMMDLDFFKQTNDQYGHQAGNEALRWVARLLREKLRVVDVACRYGGEEFTLILPGTSLSQSTRTAERLRSTLHGSPMRFNDQEIKLSASFGVASYRATDRLSPDDVIERADRFLRLAKSRGRNQVCCEETQPSRPDEGLTSDERAALYITRWRKP